MTAIATKTAAELAEAIITPTPRLSIDNVIRTMEDHHARAVPIPKELADAIPLVVAGLMRNDSPRIRAAAVKLTNAALAHNLRVYEVADKSSRLDTGQATERVEQTHTVSFDRSG
jgi:hypothetical protein